MIAVRVSLMNNLDVCEDDCEAITSLKMTLTQLLDKHYVVNDLHYVAAILDPRLKNNENLVPAV